MHDVEIVSGWLCLRPAGGSSKGSHYADEEEEEVKVGCIWR